MTYTMLDIYALDFPETVDWARSLFSNEPVPSREFVKCVWI